MGNITLPKSLYRTTADCVGVNNTKLLLLLTML